jgi:hypothetical protein
MTSTNPYIQTSPNDVPDWLGEETAAVGEESAAVSRAFEIFLNEYFIPVYRESTPYIRFHRLKEKWEAETAFLSSVSNIVMHPTYQQIIGMGPMAIPLILREVSIKQGQWFWALKSITNEDPVKPEQRGIVAEMSRAWLQWGKERGYID